MKALTEIQKQVLSYVAHRIDEGKPPTQREISSEFGWATHAASAHHLLALQKKGYLRVKTDVSRGIEVLRHP